MHNTQGIPHLVHLASVIGQGGSIFHEAVQDDGRVSLWEILSFFPLLRQSSAVLEDLKSIPAELLDIDSDEGRELVAAVEASLKPILPIGADTAAIAIAALRSIRPVADLINAFRGRGLPAEAV